MAKFGNYISEAFQELKTSVTVFSVIFALLTWGVDQLFVKALEGFFNIIK
jgi:preprotein translocase subunit SecE